MHRVLSRFYHILRLLSVARLKCSMSFWVRFLNPLSQIGYEQANKYAIKTSTGDYVGFIAEEDRTFVGTIVRQFLGTRRSFNADILDAGGQVVLKIRRPIKWFLNSQISIFTGRGELIGEVHQSWHLWRRQYDLFLRYLLSIHSLIF